MHHAAESLYQKGLGEKDAAWLSSPPTSKQLGKLYYQDAATSRQARFEQWTSGEVSGAITRFTIQKTILNPPDYRR